MVCGIRPWAGDEPETGTGSSCHVRYDVRPAAALREALPWTGRGSVVYIANVGGLSRTFILPANHPAMMHSKCPADTWTVRYLAAVVSRTDESITVVSYAPIFEPVMNYTFSLVHFIFFYPLSGINSLE